jgi:hypothetical protein
MAKTKDPTDLQSLPSIGPSLAQDLRDLGFHAPADLHGQDPERMFTDLCELRGQKIDRCVLYSFRCAVHAVISSDKDPELAKWWNWKDRTL